MRQSINNKSLLAVVVSCSLLFTGCGKRSDDGLQNHTQSDQCTAAPSGNAKSQATLHRRFILKTQSATNTQAAELAELRSLASVQVIGESTYLLEFPEERGTKEVAKLFPHFQYLEADLKIRTQSLPDDPNIANQWAHNIIQSSQAWEISRGSATVTVAVVDTGIDVDHLDLEANIWTNPREILNGRDNDGNGLVGDVHGWNFVGASNDIHDDDSRSHGTHVAGTIGAVGNNRIGISGHAQEVKLMPLKFLDSTGEGYVSNAIKAIDYAVSKGAKIINNSWGYTSCSRALSEAIDRTRRAGILFVVAAGNSGENNDSASFYPANFPQDNIVSVAASDSADRMSLWSNFGAGNVDLAAPGAVIYSAQRGDMYQSLSGTSMAASVVSGVLATMVALRPDLSYREIKAALLQNVDQLASLSGKLLSNGRINAYKALVAIQPEP